MNHKSHIHAFFTVMLLLGSLLVLGSFEAHLPDSAIAASTPGSQSVQKNAVWNFNYGQPDSYDTAAMTQVNYTGEVRDKSTGALLTSDTKLKPGDKVTLDIFANASYFVTGAWNDSPPAHWGANPASNLLSSPWVFRGSSFSFKGAQVFTYEYKQYPLNLTFPNAPADYCPSGHLTAGANNNIPFCLLNSLENPAVGISPSGMNCNQLSSSNVSEGQRKYSTTCTITTSGPQATLTTNIDATQFYYPARAREMSQEPGTANQESFISGYEPSDHNPGVPAGCGEYDEGPPCFETAHVVFNYDYRNIANFYSAGTIDAATLSWNIDVVSPPTADIKANGSDGPIGIAYNTAATISWSSTNAESCTASSAWSGSKPTSGSESTGNLTSNKTYTITCTNVSGSSSDSVTVNVGAAPTAADIKANNSDGPITISYNTAATISWTSSHADSCSVSPTGWTGTSNAGISTGNLTSSKTYILSCTGGGNPSSDSVTVNVGAASPPTLTFWGDPTTITQGNSSMLNWTLGGGPADNCTASGGWSGSKSTSGGSESVTPPSTTTYKLECSGPGDSSGIKSVTITVNPAPVCTPGDTQTQNCTTATPENCPGTQTRTCQSDSQWGAFGSCNDVPEDGCPVPAMPDLLIKVPQHSPTDPTEDQEVTIKAVSSNEGTAGSGAYKTRVRLDLNSNGWTSGEPESIQDMPAQGVGSGDWVTMNWTATLGTHQYQFCADVSGQVNESNEGNNCSPWQSLTVTTTVCPENQAKPHNECKSGSCTSVNTCGTPSCSSNSQCGGFKEI